ncbi:Chitinase 1 [Psilocybe cubensis]|uniref:chitinase n=2 Tax=Psilocybe cubensis TaxID=181762 RepID=A0A8H7XXB8_PSICU|nr:Chitinase 1 [Psilocybe cubensis]KAH9475936.1 Chitinase 1 [Psilocybe cubensis]
MLLATEATQIMRRPDTYKDVPHRYSIETDPKTHVIHRRATGKVSMAYFTNWGIYGANFQPTDIVPGPLTHILYAFADVSPDTGTISLTDSYADEQKHFPTDSWNDTGNNLYGCLKQLYLLKLAQRNLKVLLSIGGWTYSQAGHFDFVTSASSRATFVASAVQLIEDYGFDGIDIDFEYPANTAQGQGLADLMTSLRTAFDNLAAQKGDQTTYLLTAAVAAGPANYAFLQVPQMNAALSFWNLMAYDYAGSWLTYSDNQANVYGGARTGFSTDAAVKFYFGAGASPNKFVLGMPLYGHAFENTAGLGQPYSGIGPGTIEAGIYSYSALPLAGAQVFENTTDISSYSYNSATQELVSYDTPNIVKLKVQYLESKGMAGSMFWELSTDKVGSQSLVGVSASGLGALDQTPNHINFPNSKWDNIRNNMGQGGSSTVTSTKPTSTAPVSTSTPSTTAKPTTSTKSTTAIPSSTASSGSLCAGVAAWVSNIAYTGGATVTYGGHLWSAQWWTQADTPGGAAGVWIDKGAC